MRPLARRSIAALCLALGLAPLLIGHSLTVEAAGDNYPWPLTKSVAPAQTSQP